MHHSSRSNIVGSQLIVNRKPFMKNKQLNAASLALEPFHLEEI